MSPDVYCLAENPGRMFTAVALMHGRYLRRQIHSVLLTRRKGGPRSPTLQADSLLPEPPGKPTHLTINSPTQGMNPGLPSCRWILYQLSQQGSPRILEWVAYPFSSGSSQPENQTGVSCIAGGFFTSLATREAL